MHLRSIAGVLSLVALLTAPALREALSAENGIASIYSGGGDNRTASGQRLNRDAMTAAHRTLPFGSKVRVTNKRNGRSVVVTINDRGPFIRGRVIDLTPAAARELGFSGIVQVAVEREVDKVVARQTASMRQDDDRVATRQAASTRQDFESLWRYRVQLRCDDQDAANNEAVC
jgi:rare lipoprotein A